MIDLHSHPLPGVDDGADTLDTSIEMCRLAAADGCTVMVATPHQRHHHWSNLDRNVLNRKLFRLRQAVESELELHLGGEIRVDSDLLEDLANWQESGLQPLAGSRYLLLEYDRSGIGPDPESLVYELGLLGWRPILAHPEFIPRLGNDVSLLRRLVKAGATLQVTAMSVTGDFGQRAKQLAHRLMDEDLVHFIASDSHGLRGRPPLLSRAYEAVAELWGDAAASRLLKDNPQAVIEDRPLGSQSESGSPQPRESMTTRNSS